MMDLAGKAAFVTGAASGIGFAVAKALLRAGARVMLCDIDGAALASALESLGPANSQAAGTTADVSLKAELRRAADATVERFGGVNILVNNAGVGGGGVYPAWSDSVWEWTIGVNLMSVVWGVEIFAPLIEKSGNVGHIVSTASIVGLLPMNSNAYSPTKYAVVALSEALRREFAPRGIGVSVLCPGRVRTDIVDSHRHLPERYGEENRAALAARARSETATAIRAQIAAGVDPGYVGELVREAIEQNLAYVFTDLEHEGFVSERFEAIKAGFDAVRARSIRT